MNICECGICEKGMCQVCTRQCIVCEEERCSRCCDEMYSLNRSIVLMSRGEERDPVCLVCLTEYKPDGDYSDGESGQEMVQNGS